MKTIQKSFAILVMLLMLQIMSSNITEAQVMGGVDLTKVETEVIKAKTQIADILNPVIGIVMFLLMIGVIYLVGTAHQKAKEAAIGWFIALVFWGLGYLLLG